MDDDVIIVYADIWFYQEAFDKIVKSCDDISICVDGDWEDYYIGRTDHPITQAENVLYDDSLNIHEIGKHIYKDSNNKLKTGEFMGLLKISKNIVRRVVKEFEDLEKEFLLTQPFKNAETFEKAYLTDFIKHLIDKKYNIKCSLTSKGWYEIDTVQDLENLKRMMDNENK